MRVIFLSHVQASLWFVFWILIGTNWLKVQRRYQNIFKKTWIKVFPKKFLISFNQRSSNTVSFYVVFYIVFLCSKKLKKRETFPFNNYAIELSFSILAIHFRKKQINLQTKSRIYSRKYLILPGLQVLINLATKNRYFFVGGERGVHSLKIFHLSSLLYYAQEG